MESQKHIPHEHWIHKKKTRIQKLCQLWRLGNRESVCFHESGHTVMSILLHGEHEKQIQHPLWWLATSSLVWIYHAELTAEEKLAIFLAWFAGQKIQNHDLFGEKMFDYSLENKYTLGLSQPDTLSWLHILRKEFKRRWHNISPEEQGAIIRTLVEKITKIFKSHKKLTFLIEILARKNREKSVLNRKDINECIVESWISGHERVEWANEIRNIWFFDLPSLSSPLLPPE